MLDAAKIAQSLFSDGAYESDSSRRMHARVVHRANDAKHHGQPAAVVADSGAFEHNATRSLARDLDVGALWKNCVEVCRENQMRRGASRCRAGARPLTQNVARSEEHTSELQSRLHLVCR